VALLAYNNFGVRALLYIPMLFLVTACAGQADDKLTLDCLLSHGGRDGLEVWIEPMSAEEAARLHSAPSGAKRLSKHQIEVDWVDGKKTFEDEQPYDEPYLTWIYCGYNATLKLHLLSKSDGDLSTGVLLNDETGSLLAGGQTVMFSPDREYYVAYDQPDGLDGKTLKLYTKAGAMLWEGYNGVLASDGISFVAAFENLRWDGQDQPQVTVRLGESRTSMLTLTQGIDGKREWLPRLVCKYEGPPGKYVLRCD
jgi:hypothetical protein